MKKSIFYLLLATIFVFTNGCDEVDIDSLLKDVAVGKMIVVIDDGDEEILDCTFMHYGSEGSWDGEVFIDAMKSSTDTREQTTLSLMYGSYSNDIALTTKVYSSAADDLMSVSTTYGSTSDDAVITITITEISATAIKGTFIGKLSTKSGLVDAKGAFWATPGAQN
jgi:hypothetical protein